ncbi:MAG: MBOAT family protein [Desulfatirhabdiaceae bacterium]
MVFSSVIFLFLFLPITVTLYLISGQKLRNYLLLFASLIFYSWGEGFYVLLMLVSVCINYAGGLLIVRFHPQRPSRLILTGVVILNIGLLAAFKYGNFLVDNLNIFLNVVSVPQITIDKVHLPIGISFFTFQAMSYVIDVYRNPFLVQKKFSSLALYISLFPQLIAGPIVRYQDIAGQMADRRMTLHDFSRGFERFIWGLGKKVLIANPLANRADEIFAIASGDLTTGLAWYGIVCYTLQIFFDFSGYSDMAIGLGRMFGFRFLENFQYPYISQSIQEFWRRWHMSLSTWFRDYLYIPLGGNRKGPARTYFNLMFVFFLCGLWHGSSWTFVIWGLFHGIFLVLERTAFGRFITGLWRPLRHGYAMLIVMTGWVFFRAETLKIAFRYLEAMAGFAKGDGVIHYFAFYWDNKIALACLFGMVCSLPLAQWLSRFRGRMVARCNGWISSGLDGFMETVQVLSTATILMLSIMQLSVGAYNPFIYFRF